MRLSQCDQSECLTVAISYSYCIFVYQERGTIRLRDGHGRGKGPGGRVSESGGETEEKRSALGHRTLLAGTRRHHIMTGRSSCGRPSWRRPSTISRPAWRKQRS